MPLPRPWARQRLGRIPIAAWGVAVLASLLIAAPATAATRDDPDDVAGRLDLRRVTRTFSNGPSAPPLVHFQATTYGEWTLRACQRVDSCSFVFGLDSRRGPSEDVLAFWDVDRHRRPSCNAYNARTGGFLAAGDAAKFRRSAFCSFPTLVLRRDKPVRWRVQSLWGLIVDDAPDQGWF
jgi:hypothetical protein